MYEAKHSIMSYLLCAYGLMCLLGRCTSVMNPYPRAIGRSEERSDVGNPLFLTPYIEAGKIDEGRKASQVPPLLDNIVSFSGFLTVNKKYGSNLFFWFFPAENSSETAPVALWLQGGPGASSIYAIFEENGPYRLETPRKVRRNLHYWTQKLNVIYIDQPVGTGFSFTQKREGYANSEADVGSDLYEALLQFFQLFPEYSKNDFLLTGESYAGKYIPALAYTIHKNNPGATHKINLKGVAIGNGWVDPLEMIDYANLLFTLDFIDLTTKQVFQKNEADIKSLMKEQKYLEAYWALDKYMDGDLTGYPSLVQNVTGIKNYFNILKADKNDTDSRYASYLNTPDVRRSIHVGNLTFNDGNDEVVRHLMVDELLSIVPWLEVIMDHYRVLIYNGQLDLICAYPLTMNYVRKLKWKGAEEYAKAARKQWFVGTQLAGYAKSAGNFTELLVRNAGHMVPGDQPLWALDMIMKFANNEPF